MVCEYFDVPYDKLLQKTCSKVKLCRHAKSLCIYQKAFYQKLIKTIGEHFGGRDHTTVIHSCQTVKI